jgi:choline dehydrogenase-like flavoprotein
MCRLTEVQHWSVLLLEAGGEEPSLADVPAFLPISQRSKIDWNYELQPINGSCGNQPCRWPRGKVLGGSSVLNGMIYIRGNPLDYDHWADLGIVLNNGCEKHQFIINLTPLYELML